MTAKKTPVPEPFSFTWDGKKYPLPTFDPGIQGIEPPALADLATRKADLIQQHGYRTGIKAYENELVELNFANQRLIIEAHLRAAVDAGDTDAPVAAAQAIESMLTAEDYDAFFAVFREWMIHDLPNADEAEPAGESSGSPES